MILSVAQIRASEQWTMEQEAISSLTLMERAATRFTDTLKSILLLDDYDGIFIFCGPGNNGGDGFAIARLLAEEQLPVTAISVSEQEQHSPDCAHNRERFKELTSRNSRAALLSFSGSVELSQHPLIIDAIFGIGISKPAKGYYAEAIDFINHLNATIVAVDVPSGLFPDNHTPEHHPVVRATLTLTFQWLKQAYVMPENAHSVRKCTIVDIGLILPDGTKPIAKLIDRETASLFLRTPHLFDHKGSNGHGLLIAGSEAMPGAAILAARSALRGGIGKVTVHTAKRNTVLLAGAVPEAIWSADREEQCFSGIELSDSPYHSIAVGPGIGRHPKTVSGLKNLLDDIHSSIILDADALNILAEHKTYLAYLPQNSILTPHFKEFEKLNGKADHDFHRWEKLQQFAVRYGVIMILKGAYSVIALPDGKLLVNTTGNPGMATAGSGDVLTGLLLALAAKGYSCSAAAVLGTYIHGLAGDFALEQQSWESLIASDIIDNFGNAFNYIRHEE